MNIFEKKYQIFISSTYKDLVKAREEVIKVILDIYQVPIGMEMFSADNDDQWDVIKHTIDSSDYYLLIVGHRYGSLTKEGISYTEKEFDYARENKIPVLVFVRDSNVSTTPEERDTDPKLIQKLAKFREKVTTGILVNFWKTEVDLGQKVSTALTKTFAKNPRIGWVRGDQATSSQVTEQLAALIKENRDLRDELDLVKKSAIDKKPRFNILINGSENPQINFEENIGEALDYIQNVSQEDLPIPKRLGKYLPLFDDYNGKLGFRQGLVDQYNKEMELFLRKCSPVQLSFTLENKGTAKANNVIYEVQFPNELLIVDRTPSSDAEIPKWPAEIPENPILYLTLGSARERFRRKLRHYMGPYSSLNYRIANNKVTIEYASLLHTRESTTVLSFVPLKKGDYTLEVKYICEEFQTQVNDTITISVI